MIPYDDAILNFSKDSFSYNHLTKEQIKTLTEELSEKRSATMLDLSGNTLDYDDGSLLAIAYNKNSCLTSLDLSRMSTYADFHFLSGFVKSLTSSHLVSLNLSSNILNDYEFLILANLISQHRLMSLDLSKNRFSNEGFCLLAEALVKNHILKTLNLRATELNHPKIKALANALKKNKSLTALDISRNDLNDLEIRRELFEMLLKNQSLKLLNMSDTRLASRITVLEMAFIRNESLTALDFSRNDLKDKDCAQLASILRGNNGIASLVLHHNAIGSRGACELAKALAKNSSLTLFDISCNPIKIKGIQALAKALSQNRGLRTLKLVHVYLSPETTIKQAELEALNTLIRALVQNNHLTALDISNNNLSTAGASAIAELIDKGRLSSLILENTGLDDENIHMLAAALEKNVYLKSLYLQRNEIGDEGAHRLAAALLLNTGVRKLHLDQNQIGDHGACALSEMLTKNINLVELNISSNKLGIATIRAFKAVSVQKYRYSRSFSLDITWIRGDDDRMAATTLLNEMNISLQLNSFKQIYSEIQTFMMGFNDKFGKNSTTFKSQLYIPLIMKIFEFVGSERHFKYINKNFEFFCDSNFLHGKDLKLQNAKIGQAAKRIAPKTTLALGERKETKELSENKQKVQQKKGQVASKAKEPILFSRSASSRTLSRSSAGSAASLHTARVALRTTAATPRSKALKESKRS